MVNETSIVSVSVNPFKGVGEIKASLVDAINKLITYFVPGYEVYFIWLISFLMAFLIKRRFKINWIVTVIVTIVIFSAMRYWGFPN